MRKLIVVLAALITLLVAFNFARLALELWDSPPPASHEQVVPA
ncbi:hypothetical protein [Corynebacterium vitaeruminis]|nr:hypothetical protein [Corynebacterium vitaeruminis]